MDDFPVFSDLKSKARKGYVKYAYVVTDQRSAYERYKKFKLSSKDWCMTSEYGCIMSVTFMSGGEVIFMHAKDLVDPQTQLNFDGIYIENCGFVDYLKSTYLDKLTVVNNSSITIVDPTSGALMSSDK